MLINGSAINVAVINGEPPGTLYSQAVTASSTAVASFVKTAETVKSVLSTSVVSIVRQVGKVVTGVSTATVTVLKALIKEALSVISTVTATLIKQINK